MTTTARQQALVNYYTRQAGGGMNVFRGGYNQRGHGLGNMLSSVFKLVRPLAMQGVKAVGRQALTSGLSAIQDMARGTPVKQALKRRGRQAVDQLIVKANRRAFPPGLRLPSPPQRRTAPPRRAPHRRAIKGRRARTAITRVRAPRRINPDIFS